MEPFTIIMQALLAGATVAGKEMVSTSVKDGYTGLKKVLLQRFRKRNDLKHALKQLEKKPGSHAWQDVLKEEIERTGAHKDEVVAKRARSFLDLLKGEGHSKIVSYWAQQTGNGAIAQGPGSTAAGRQGTAIRGDIGGDVIFKKDDKEASDKMD